MLKRFLHSAPQKHQLKPISLYVHWPYCSQICPYCDFNKYLDPRRTTQNVDYDAKERKMEKSYLRELSFFLEKARSFLRSEQRFIISSIYFGGGTPSLAKPSVFESIVGHLKGEKLLSNDTEDIEITLEANPPDCLDASRLQSFRKVGVNRISLGVQALNDSSLQFLGRHHTVTDVHKSIANCTEIFPRVSMDLIYGRPNQTSQEWKKELETAMSFGANHLSLYSLTVEPNTKLFKMVQPNWHQGKVELPEEGVVADMFQLNQQVAERKGFQQYEVSNFAKPNYESRHNIHYWNGLDYIGIGPGAAGRLTNSDGIRTAFKQILHPDKWSKNIETLGNGIGEETELTNEAKMMEILLSGLRQLSGLDRNHFLNQSNGKSLEEIFDQSTIKQLCAEGFLECDAVGMRVTRTKGLPVLDSVIDRLVLSM